MKKSIKSPVIVLPTLAVAVVVLLSSLSGFGQQTAKTEKHSKVVVKMITDDNGTRTVVDTAFELPDSALTDSVNREIEKVIKIGHDGKCGAYRIYGMPEGYSFDFDIPDLPDCPMALEELRELGFDGGMPEEFLDGNFDMPAPPPVMMRHLRGGQSLNDLLGDIPMERVKNYSIKDTKNGKRITIDIDNAPFFEKKKDRVVIIRGEGREKGEGQRQKKHVKVIVNPDGEGKSTAPAQGEPGDAPPPPPPPPPGKKI